MNDFLIYPSNDFFIFHHRCTSLCFSLSLSLSSFFLFYLLSQSLSSYLTLVIFIYILGALVGGNIADEVMPISIADFFVTKKKNWLKHQKSFMEETVSGKFSSSERFKSARSSQLKGKHVDADRSVIKMREAPLGIFEYTADLLFCFFNKNTLINGDLIVTAEAEKFNTIRKEEEKDNKNEKENIQGKAIYTKDRKGNNGVIKKISNRNRNLNEIQDENEIVSKKNNKNGFKNERIHSQKNNNNDDISNSNDQGGDNSDDKRKLQIVAKDLQTVYDKTNLTQRNKIFLDSYDLTFSSLHSYTDNHSSNSDMDHHHLDYQHTDYQHTDNQNTDSRHTDDQNTDYQYTESYRNFSNTKLLEREAANHILSSGDDSKKRFDNASENSKENGTVEDHNQMREKNNEVGTKEEVENGQINDFLIEDEKREKEGKKGEEKERDNKEGEGGGEMGRDDEGGKEAGEEERFEDKFYATNDDADHRIVKQKINKTKQSYDRNVSKDKNKAKNKDKNNIEKRKLLSVDEEEKKKRGGGGRTKIMDEFRKSIKFPYPVNDFMTYGKDDNFTLKVHEISFLDSKNAIATTQHIVETLRNRVFINHFTQTFFFFFLFFFFFFFSHILLNFLHFGLYIIDLFIF